MREVPRTSRELMHVQRPESVCGASASVRMCDAIFFINGVCSHVPLAVGPWRETNRRRPSTVFIVYS